jgi:hypothetical protein
VPRRLPAIVALLLVVGAAVAVVLRSGGGGERPARRVDARAEALAYVGRGAPAVVDVDTGAPAARLVVEQLVPRLTGGALDAADIGGLLGREAVVALLDARGRRTQLSLVAPDERAMAELTRRLPPAGAYRGARLYAPRGGRAVVAARGTAIVVAPDAAAVRRALDVRADRRAHLTPKAFDARLAGLPRGAPAGAVFDPRPLLVAREPRAGASRWVRALRNGAAALTVAGTELRLPFRLQTDPARLTGADLPVAAGARPPTLHGTAPLVVGVRDFARTLAFARRIAPERFAALDELQGGLPGFLRLDVRGLLGGLTGDATLTSADLDHLVARTDPRDPEAWRRPLGRLATVSAVLQRLGIGDVALDEEPGDAYRLAVNGDLVARAGIFGRTLVATDAAGTDLPAVAAAPPEPAPPGAAGAVVARLRAPTLQALVARALDLPALARPLLRRLGDLTGWARAERDGVRGELRLALR